MKYIFEDPRPNEPDTALWRSLLRTIHRLDDRSIAYLLQRRLWTLRSAGTMLRRTRNDIRFIPHPNGSWDNDEFESMKLTYLKPYAKEIKSLLDRL